MWLSSLSVLPSCWDSGLRLLTPKCLIWQPAFSLLWPQHFTSLGRHKRWQRILPSSRISEDSLDFIHFMLSGVFRITPEMDRLIKAYTRRQPMFPMTWFITIIITVVIIILRKYGLWFRSLTRSPALRWEQSRHLCIHSSQQPDEGGTGVTILQMAKLKLSACSWPHNNVRLKAGEKGPWSGKEKAAPSDAVILLWKVPSLGACLLSSPGGSFDLNLKPMSMEGFRLSWTSWCHSTTWVLNLRPSVRRLSKLLCFS